MGDALPAGTHLPACPASPPQPAGWREGAATPCLIHDGREAGARGAPVGSPGRPLVRQAAFPPSGCREPYPAGDEEGEKCGRTGAPPWGADRGGRHTWPPWRVWDAMALVWPRSMANSSGAQCPAPPTPPGWPGTCSWTRRSEQATVSQGRARGPFVPPGSDLPFPSRKRHPSFSSQEHRVELCGGSVEKVSGWTWGGRGADQSRGARNAAWRQRGRAGGWGSCRLVPLSAWRSTSRDSAHH